MIPNELKRLNKWVNYVPEIKIPLDPKTGKAASSTDPSTWGTYEQSKASSENIGFVFDDTGYYGIDLDDCVVSGKLNSFAREILGKTRSYAEYSPSGTGIHIICKGSLKDALKLPGLEAYGTGRYFTVTGKNLYPLLPIRNVSPSFLDAYRPIQDKASFDLGTKLNSIREGGRNNDFTAIAGSLRARNYSAESIFELLIPKARELKFPEEELRSICFKSAAKWAPRAEYSQATDESDSLEDFMQDAKPVDWLCPPYLQKATLGFITGVGDACKSWLMLDLAVEACRGGRWLGRFDVKPSKVLFIDQERPKAEFQRRLKALLTEKGLNVSDLSGKLTVKTETTFCVNNQASFENLKRKIEAAEPDLLIIDSFATIHGLEENNKSDMQYVMEKLKLIRNQYKCTIVMIDHEGKSAFQDMKDRVEVVDYSKQSGSAAKPYAGEFSLTVRPCHEGSWIYHTKANLGPKAPPVLTRVRDLNSERTSIVVEAI